MAKRTKETRKFKFNKHQIIGSPDAESDHVLDQVFVDIGAYDVLCDIENPKCIIIGRTGSGKSALLKKIEDEQDKVKRIAPESMSIKFLSNSTILTYLRGLEVNLNFFYKLLWKHVFIVEILKLYIDENERKKSSLLQMLSDTIKDKFGAIKPSKKKAIEYLEQWTDEFWLKTEHRIKSLEQTLEKRLTSEAGIDLKYLTAKSIVGRNLIDKTQEEVKYKAEDIISNLQAEELYNIIQMLKEDIFSDSQKKYYIIIDDLDKEWVSPQIVYDLIAAMIDVIKEFSFFKGVKIIIALRENLHNLVFAGKSHRGGQREKYSSLYLNLTWDNDRLREIVDRRIKHLSENTISFQNLFNNKHGGGYKSGWDYILERSYYRPRDIISYINKIIENSENKSLFNASLIKKAEPLYSIERLHALEDEWEENFGDFTKACTFLVGVHDGFNLFNIKEDPFASIYLERDFHNYFKGELHQICSSWKEDKLNFKSFAKELIIILYRIGVLGLKLRPNLAIQFFYSEISPISSADLDNNTKIYVHKSLFSYFKIISKEQEIDF